MKPPFPIFGTLALVAACDGPVRPGPAAVTAALADRPGEAGQRWMFDHGFAEAGPDTGLGPDATCFEKARPQRHLGTGGEMVFDEIRVCLVPSARPHIFLRGPGAGSWVEYRNGNGDRR